MVDPDDAPTTARTGLGWNRSVTIRQSVRGDFKLVLAMLMFLGRIGPLTLGSAIALPERRILYELPKERPAVG